MKDIRVIEKRAKELGILDINEDEMIEFFSIDDKEYNNIKLPEFIDRNLIEYGEKMDSYYDALLFFIENDLINEQEIYLIKDSSFYDFLKEELEEKNVIKKEKDVLW